MRINPLYASYKANTNNLNNNIKARKSKNPSFTSFLADANSNTEKAYAYYTILNPDFKQLKASSTRIFRELPSQIAISKLIDPDKKTQINILGCADGSEAWAYAIVMKEAFDKKAKENISIKAVDYAPYMIDIAKTGRIVISDIEREYANGGNTKDGTSSPIKGDGWDKHLIKSKRPEGFASALKKYPFLKYMEVDPVIGKTIGKGLDWYEINKENLPEIDFVCDDMRNHLNSTDGADLEVYVIANTGGYLASKSMDDYIKIFRNIKEANAGKDKEVYVVIGDLENRLLNPNFGRMFGLDPKEQTRAIDEIKKLGFKKLSNNQLKKHKVENFKDASSKIYKLN